MEDNTVVIQSVAAIGSILSALIALVLATKERMRKLEFVFHWDEAKDIPILEIYNCGNHLEVVNAIDIQYAGKTILKSYIPLDNGVSFEDVLLEPKKYNSIAIAQADFLFDIKLLEEKEREHDKRKYKMKIIVTTAAGKRYKAEYRYTKEQLSTFLVTYEFNSDLHKE